jgi:hypothetical protein
VSLGMKHVLVSFSLALVAVFAPSPPYRVDDAITSTLNCMPATETNHQHEVHAVVVDMPQRASLEYASPETWGGLPTFDQPEEESPTKPVLQVALN